MLYIENMNKIDLLRGAGEKSRVTMGPTVNPGGRNTCEPNNNTHPHAAQMASGATKRTSDIPAQ